MNATVRGDFESHGDLWSFVSDFRRLIIFGPRRFWRLTSASLDPEGEARAFAERVAQLEMTLRDGELEKGTR